MAVAPFREAIDAVALAGGEALKQCYQCGLCTGTCPWNLVKSFPTRKLIHQAQLGLVDFESEDTWTCATCRACVARCPRGVAIIDIMRALRNIVAEMGVGHLPDSLRVTLKNIAGTGNPLGEPAERRTDWINDSQVTTFTGNAELLYFSCCIPAYDPNVRRVARSTAKVFHKAGVRFAITGDRENCCGESVRKAGNETLFQKLAHNNIAAFTESGINKIVVTSPHCYYTFKNEYPKLGGSFEVTHYTEYMAQLLKEGRLKPTRPVNAKVTYHDPCYSGTAQQHLRCAARDTEEHPRHRVGRDARPWARQPVLRRWRGANLDGNQEGRKALRSAAGSGSSHWIQHTGGSLPILHPQFRGQHSDHWTGLDRIEVKDISELLAEAL